MSRDGGSHQSAAGGLVVVAHPDDETLWLEPWLAADTTVVVAFPTHPRDPSITAARQGLRARFPYGAMEFLPLISLDVLGQSDWRRRSPTRFGVELGRDCPADLRRAYLDNHRKLCDLLNPYVAEHPVVYTHNPWGEYGHEEHIQVSRAVLDVGAMHGTSVWAWDGLSTRQLAESSMRLRVDYFEPALSGLPRTTRRSDIARYRELKRLYRDADVWTWASGYEPPAAMDYVEIMHEGRELLPPVPPRSGARAVGIALDHLRHGPRIASRVVRHGRLRSG